jgi:hypothetical protein
MAGQRARGSRRGAAQVRNGGAEMGRPGSGCGCGPLVDDRRLRRPARERRVHPSAPSSPPPSSAPSSPADQDDRRGVGGDRRVADVVRRAAAAGPLRAAPEVEGRPARVRQLLATAPHGVVVVVPGPAPEVQDHHVLPAVPGERGDPVVVVDARDRDVAVREAIQAAAPGVQRLLVPQRTMSSGREPAARRCSRPAPAARLWLWSPTRVPSGIQPPLAPNGHVGL